MQSNYKKMTLLNLMLAILVFMLLLRRLEYFIYFDFPYRISRENYSLLFIKPENLTKIELVEKFKELSSSKSLKDLKNIKNEGGDKVGIRDLFKSYYNKLSALIFKYKDLITKITLFTILIKYFRKIKLLRFIWRIIKYITLSTFGIFITDIYGLKEIIAEIEYNWMKYVSFIHESKIYKILVKIFGVINDNEIKSEVIEDEFKIVENKSKSNTIKSDFPSNEGQLKNEKIVHDKTSGGNEKENWFQLEKLVLIGISIISLSLIYIYWDSISEFFKKPDLGGEGESNITETPVFLSHEEEYQKYFKELDINQELYDLDVIRSQDKGKVIDYSEVENTKWEDSPTTPKTSQSELPKTDRVMLPFSK